MSLRLSRNQEVVERHIQNLPTTISLRENSSLHTSAQSTTNPDAVLTLHLRTLSRAKRHTRRCHLLLVSSILIAAHEKHVSIIRSTAWFDSSDAGYDRPGCGLCFDNIIIMKQAALFYKSSIPSGVSLVATCLRNIASAPCACYSNLSRCQEPSQRKE